MAESMWTLPFGKYKGRDVEDVPDSYLEWLLEQDWFPKYQREMEIVKKEMNYRITFNRRIRDEWEAK